MESILFVTQRDRHAEYISISSGQTLVSPKIRRELAVSNDCLPFGVTPFGRRPEWDLIVTAGPIPAGALLGLTSLSLPDI